MNVLLVGFGSIGKRHFDVLKGLSAVKSIEIVTRQMIDEAKCFVSLQEVGDMKAYDYFIVASETIKHFEQLKYICSQVMNKKILVEKPLYDQNYEPFNLNHNQIYTGYNLRFHPVLQQLKRLLEGQEVYYANVLCGQYLPTWRPEQDYRESYSADVMRGGGVLRDLSHELDYARWFFGKLIRLYPVSVQRSDLEINADDIFTVVGVTDEKVVINITLDYISKHPIRRLIIHTQNMTIEADVIKGLICISGKSGELKQVAVDAVDRNFTYTQMHLAVLNGEVDSLCGFEEGLGIVSMIDQIHIDEL